MMKYFKRSVEMAALEHVEEANIFYKLVNLLGPTQLAFAHVGI